MSHCSKQRGFCQVQVGEPIPGPPAHYLIFGCQRFELRHNDETHLSGPLPQLHQLLIPTQNHLESGVYPLLSSRELKICLAKVCRLLLLMVMVSIQSSSSRYSRSPSATAACICGGIASR